MYWYSETQWAPSTYTIMALVSVHQVYDLVWSGIDNCPYEYDKISNLLAPTVHILGKLKYECESAIIVPAGKQFILYVVVLFLFVWNIQEIKAGVMFREIKSSLQTYLCKRKINHTVLSALRVFSLKQVKLLTKFTLETELFVTSFK